MSADNLYPPVATHISDANAHTCHLDLRTPDRRIQRIYSSMDKERRTNMLLTITCSAWGSQDGAFEVIVNGASIPDGFFKNIGYCSRTFLLEDVVTIDLKLEGNTAVSVSYGISVPIPGGKREE